MYSALNHTTTGKRQKAKNWEINYYKVLFCSLAHHIQVKAYTWELQSSEIRERSAW